MADSAVEVFEERAAFGSRVQEVGKVFSTDVLLRVPNRVDWKTLFRTGYRIVNFRLCQNRFLPINRRLNLPFSKFRRRMPTQTRASTSNSMRCVYPPPQLPTEFLTFDRNCKVSHGADFKLAFDDGAMLRVSKEFLIAVSQQFQVALVDCA